MKFLIVILWFFIFSKKMLFWVYLWQLKEYQLARFKAHFQTAKGKKTIINYLFIFKVILAPFVLLYFYYFFWVLFLIFFLEAFVSFIRLVGKSFRKPVLTKKIIFILSIGLLLEISVIYRLILLPANVFYFLLLIFDLLTPLIFSALVLSVEPIAIFWRKKTINEAAKKREQFKDLTVIGITGSYGKTSTKEILSAILEDKFKVLKTKEHQNSEMGISRCVLNDLNHEHEIFICEMGAYKKGGIKLLCDIVKPKIGVVTGVNEQHLATFGNMDNLLSAEGGGELIDSLPQDGLAVFNGNNRYCLDLSEKTNIAKRITNQNIFAEDIKTEKEFVDFKVKTNGASADFRVNLLGGYWTENILMAVLIAKELGMSLEEIARSCLKIKPFAGAMKLIKNPAGLNIIDATYSANPNSVISHLEYLKNWSGKKIIIMPCLIELGEASEEIHRKIGEKIKESCDLAIIITEECIKSVKEKAGEEKIIFSEKPEDIYEKIKNFSGPEDVILLESRLPKELIGLLKMK